MDLDPPILNEGLTWADNDVIADKSGATWAEKVAARESSFASRRADSLPSDFVIGQSSGLPVSGQQGRSRGRSGARNRSRLACGEHHSTLSHTQTQTQI